LRNYRKDLASLKYTAYAILLLEFLAAIFLTQFWDKQVEIGSKKLSLPLLLLAFIFAFSDCTSSVVYLTFMAKYPSGYMISFYIGGGMGGVMPSVLTLAQGTVGDTCRDASSTDSPKEPRYGANLYFGLLSILIATSGIAFFLLNNLKVSLNERYDNVLPQLSTVLESEQKDASPENDDSKALQGSDQLKLTNIRVFDVFYGSRREEFAAMRWTFVQLYSIIAIVSALGNGVIPAILSYASLPYGPTTYHLATELGLIANPVCCFLAFFVACKRPSLLGILCSVSVLIAIVIIYTATLSPSPWLVGTTAGSVLIVILNVLWTGCISYIRVNVATVLQKFGENSLLFCGIFTQLGSFLGAIIIFLINFKTTTFKAC
jgi:riboflavin transporter 2